MTETFDYVFLDPPYASGLLEKALEMVGKNLKEHGLVICEHPKEQELPDETEDFILKKKYRYGKVCLTVYNKRGVMDE